MSLDGEKQVGAAVGSYFPDLGARLIAGGALLAVVLARVLRQWNDRPWPLDDPAICNLLVLIFGFVAVATIWIWFCFFSAYSLRLRRRVFWGTFAGIAIMLAMVRIVDFTGSMGPTLALRWTWRTPDQRLGKLELTPAMPIDLKTNTPDDFPQFLGPERSCWVPGPELARDWVTKPPKLVWKRPIGAGWSGFAAVNGYAVTLEQRGEDEWVACYAIATGEPVWGHSIVGRHENPMGGVGPRGTPTIDQGRVYALGATGVLRCLDGGTGKLIWSDDLRARYGLTVYGDELLVQWGRAGSPLIAGVAVVVPGGGAAGKAKNLVAFNAETGRVVWESENVKEDGSLDQISYASPSLATVAGRQQILIVNESTASGHDPATGERLWTFPWPGGSSSFASASQAVAIDGSHVLLSKGYSGGAELLELSADGGGIEVRSKWKMPKALQTKLTNVVIRDGHIYGLSEGILECVAANTGQRRWKSGRYGHGQILGVGNLLLVLSEQGELSLVELSPAKFSLLGSLPALEGKTWNTLCLYGKRLLIRNAQEAACYELP